MTWRRLLPHWLLIVADFQEVYGLILEDHLGRPWPWFRDRVFGLFGAPSSRLRLALFPPKPPRKPPA